jgi:hypothetical protein
LSEWSAGFLCLQDTEFEVYFIFNRLKYTVITDGIEACLAMRGSRWLLQIDGFATPII